MTAFCPPVQLFNPATHTNCAKYASKFSSPLLGPHAISQLHEPPPTIPMVTDHHHSVLFGSTKFDFVVICTEEETQSLQPSSCNDWNAFRWIEHELDVFPRSLPTWKETEMMYEHCNCLPNPDEWCTTSHDQGEMVQNHRPHAGATLLAVPDNEPLHPSNPMF